MYIEKEFLSETVVYENLSVSSPLPLFKIIVCQDTCFNFSVEKSFQDVL